MMQVDIRWLVLGACLSTGAIALAACSDDESCHEEPCEPGHHGGAAGVGGGAGTSGSGGTAGASGTAGSAGSSAGSGGSAQDAAAGG